jgi:hypothetical protein
MPKLMMAAPRRTADGKKLLRCSAEPGRAAIIRNTSCERAYHAAGMRVTEKSLPSFELPRKFLDNMKQEGA